MRKASLPLHQPLPVRLLPALLAPKLRTLLAPQTPLRLLPALLTPQLPARLAPQTSLRLLPALLAPQLPALLAAQTPLCLLAALLVAGSVVAAEVKCVVRGRAMRSAPNNCQAPTFPDLPTECATHAD